jgi:hypothetical protein
MDRASLRTISCGSKLIPDVMQDAKEQDGHGLAEVQRLGGLRENLLQIAQVRVQVNGDALTGAG